MATAPPPGAPPALDPTGKPLPPGAIYGDGTEDPTGAGHFTNVSGLSQVPGVPGANGAPPPGASPAAPTTGPGSDTSGQLSGPGPGEIYDATHSGDFNSPGAVETIYGQHGQDPFAAPSDSQTLFSEGMAGNDPYFSYAEQQANKAINDAASARGGFNSGAALQAIGNSTANLRGQQAAQLYGLAPEADSAERQRLAQGFDFANQNDTAKANRIGAGMALNDDWQNLEQGRLTGAFSTADTIGNQKADTTSSAYQSVLSIYNTDGMAGVDAWLQKAGIDPTSAAAKDFLTALGIGAKVGAAAGA